MSEGLLWVAAVLGVLVWLMVSITIGRYAHRHRVNLGFAGDEPALLAVMWPALLLLVVLIVPFAVIGVCVAQVSEFLVSVNNKGE